MDPVLREARPGDFDAIAAVKHRNRMPAEPWAWLWRENPACAAFPADFPMGWVLDSAGQVVGFLGNVPLQYHRDGRTLLAAVARGFVVDPAQRSHSIRLAAAFLTQKNVHLLLNTSANVPTSSIFGALKAFKIPQDDYDQALFWVVRPAGFLASVCHRRGGPRAAARLAGWAAVPALYAEMKLRKRHPVAGSGAIEVERVYPQELGQDFDDFWQRTLRDRPQCLLADRSAAVLRWRYGHPAAAMRRPAILRARRGGRIAGYTVLTREDSPDIGLNRSRIIDLIAEHDDAGVIDHLLSAAHDLAHTDGSDIVELVGFPACVRQRCIAGNPYVRQLPSWEFWYKAVDPALERPLAAPASWYGSSFDGDRSL